MVSLEFHKIENILTIRKNGEARITEKKSVFIGHASPVQDEKAALDFIDQVRTKLADANHHAFAYQIGENNQIQRANDGGEPGGTAGRPILELIKQENLKDIVVVVSRYFGGILLGTGGLVRAYGKAGHQAILDGEIVEKVFGQAGTITMDYHLLGKVQNYLSNEGIQIEGITYTDQVQVHCLFIRQDLPRIEKNLLDICYGTLNLTLGETRYFAKRKNEKEPMGQDI